MNVARDEDGLRIELDGEAETDALGRALAAVLAPDTVVGLVGPLGAGKTRLVRAIAEALDVDPLAIASPTFVLIHEYEGAIPIYHFDVYRLTSTAAFDDLGPADYWTAGGICLVEWADRVAAALPPDAWWITIEPVDPARRAVRLAAPDDALERLANLLTPPSDAPKDGP
ncbi:tRNA (adenosine(37)-N6)-threonylcarbamoyltransferase complex ATPase subunit type 1 TsaE [Paludisphaera mucosa]|uniref:tRNA threonylcarbamoyladenosine biosynthesis protein TsaE n=1 Tax=Paludisphaera mucosa TaxID=3030827 RepID=A0ABT6F9W7_9BACT|nr:tRNA (adenosine(37)-N6)-threonylcarbamoyltransferase complex ATPase subunit type 1 TsaE [Paludisphaera mucosa]MDG3004183.1 tRNA (adenosine(37)-N6)-threonylcarbamoyltransferase complex ATPase subunit type 1 TsaE [Paludisphaera mucosa]